MPFNNIGGSRRKRGTEVTRRARPVLVVALLLLAACGSPSPEDPTLRQAIDDLLGEPALHMAVSISASGEERGLAGEYEVDYEAPDRYRSVPAFEHPTALETITIGDKSFVKPLESDVWTALPVGDSSLLPAVHPRALLSTLDERCDVERSGDAFRLSLRSPTGSCGDVTAMVWLEDSQVKRIKLETPTDSGHIRASVSIISRTISSPITVPTRLGNDE